MSKIIRSGGAGSGGKVTEFANPGGRRRWDPDDILPLSDWCLGATASLPGVGSVLRLLVEAGAVFATA